MPDFRSTLTPLFFFKMKTKISKEYISKNLKSGDLIKVITTIPLVYHYAIYININGEPHFIHNTVEHDVCIYSYKKFFKDRWYLGFAKTKYSGLDENAIIKRYKEFKYREYNATSFNCEDFVEEFLGEKLKKNQFKYFFIAAISLSLLGIIISIIIKNQKQNGITRNNSNGFT